VFLSQLLNGIVTGSGYGIVAVGLTYTLGLARIFNFAYGTFYVFAAYVAIKLSPVAAGGYVLASLIAVLAIATGGIIFAIVVVFPSIRRSDLAVMIATLGVDIALTNVGQKIFGANTEALNSPLTNHLIRLGGHKVSAQGILTVVASFALTGFLSWFILKTRRGTQLRAAAEHSELAAASGINVSVNYILAVVIGIVVAALGAVLYAPLTVVTSSSGNDILLISFAVIALAGVGQLWGALAVGFGVGIFESLFVGYVNSTYPDVVVYLLLILVLLVRPRGLFRGHA
jgi:branched-chain amino acid transport system permease protein